MFSRIKLVALSAFVLIMVACSPGAAEQDEPSSPSDDHSQASARIAADGEQVLPVQMQLILGTLELDSTDLAVKSDQAVELVPLWKALRSLSNSDTAAEVEIEAVINQIQDTMTTEQIEAITALELSPDDMQTIIQDLGLEFGPPEGFEGLQGGDFTFRPGTGDFVPGEGGQFGGGGGGLIGPGGPPGGIPDNFDPEEAATARTGAGFAGFGRRAGGFLMEPLIELLEQRAGLEGTT